jgi:hypothetical protein
MHAEYSPSKLVVNAFDAYADFERSGDFALTRRPDEGPRVAFMAGFEAGVKAAVEMTERALAGAFPDLKAAE